MRRRVLAVIVWAIVLGYFTCSADPFHFQISGFNAVQAPHFSDLLTMDIHLFSPFWLMSKAGHFSGFFIMDVFLLRLLRNRKQSLVVSILFAIVTEIAQLFMGRDGRIYDMVIDSGGAVLAYYKQQDILNTLREFARRFL